MFNKNYCNKSLWRKLSLVVGLLLLFIIITYFNPVEIILNYKYLSIKYVIISLLCILLSTFIGSLNLYFFLNNSDKISFFQFLKIYWLSWAVGLVAPGQVGDMATVSILLKRSGVDLSFGMSISIVDKIISLFVVCCFSIYGIAYYFEYNYLLIIICAASIFLFMLSACCIIVLSFRKNKNILHSNNKLIVNFGVFLNKLISLIKDKIFIVFLNLMITFFKIMLIGFAYWGIFAAIGQDDQSILLVASLAALAGLIAYLPLSLNGIGTVEASGVLFFGKLGIPPAQVLAVYLLLRFMVLILAWIPSIAIIFLTPRFTTTASTLHE